MRECFFVATGGTSNLDGNILTLPEAQSQYEVLVRAVDVIVTKPGYGIVADAIAHQVPMLYTDRGEFPEYARLVEGLKDCAITQFIPQTELLAGNIGPYLKRLLASNQHWPAVALNGAQLAAQRILAVYSDQT
jgi:L-arabinokinase